MAHYFKNICGIVVFLVLITTGCKSREQTTSETIHIDSLKQISSIELSNKEYIDSYSIVKLESTNRLIHQIDQIQIFEDRIYILDQQQKRLLVFDINGKYLKDIGQFGRGKGEFIATSAFYVNPKKKTVNIIDPMRCVVLIYNLEGGLLNEQAFDGATINPGPVENMRYIGDSQVLCYANPNMFDEKMLFVIDEHDMTIKDVISVSPFKPGIAGSYIMAVQPYSIVSNDIHFLSPFSNGISSYSKGRRILTIDDGKSEANPETLMEIAEENGRDYIKTTLSLDHDRSYFRGLQNLFESSRFILCNYMFGNSFIWDKNNLSGCMLERGKDHIPELNNVFYSEGDIFVKVWDSSQIERFSTELEAGMLTSDYDQTAINIAREYDAEQDNPVLFIFNMRK